MLCILVNDALIPFISKVIVFRGCSWTEGKNNEIQNLSNVILNNIIGLLFQPEQKSFNKTKMRKT